MTGSCPHQETGYTNDTSSPLTQILILYHKATSTFLLRQPVSAYSTCLEALELLARTNKEYGLDQVTASLSTRRSFFVLKQKLWILNVTIFGAMLADRAEDEHQSGGLRKRLSGPSKEGPEKLVKDLWRRLMEDYGGLEGDVDGQVMVAFAMLCINQKLYVLAKQTTEAYLATIPEGMLIHLETAAGALTSVERRTKDPLITHYERLVELYVVHVLVKLREWDYARQFLEFNTVLSESSKKTYGKILDKLQERASRPKKTVVKKPLTTTATQATTNTLSTASSSSSNVLNSVESSPKVSSVSSIAPSTNNAASKAINEHPKSLKNGFASLGAASEAGAVRTKAAASRSGVSAGTANNAKASTALSASTLQGRLWILLQHYVDQIKHLGTQMGPNQLMAVVGVIVFLGTLSRNRTRASKAMRAVVDKVMQTIKMGTTVTSI
ncbi:hypothetical protein BC939DRAFT_473022 [Gamsiella multidivaricata]|uniref:uncharacterized protein n=1 Tax=Gamsiella multidivaricata TaxID=101098 RepID=UPI00221FAE67|nr:uncharacterized protein BC939DRAFT_473022 [Gamsiella multidivaricata]KAI7831452.1 hypothetical protein BC939DRAFT_473022 [Gamsiella multidivaricata]